MAQSVDGLYLNKYVDPQLLIERRNYRADFMQVLGSVPAGALAADGVRRNKLINNVGFRVNNTEDFEPKQMTGKNYIVPWEIYDTEPSSCTDDEIRYLAFDKRAAIRVKHNEAFQVGIRNHVLHKLAPEDDSNEEMPVIRTTGEKDINGRLRLSYKDLVDLQRSQRRGTFPLPMPCTWCFPHYTWVTCCWIRMRPSTSMTVLSTLIRQPETERLHGYQVL